MPQRNLTIESITAIEKAIGDQCNKMVMEDPKHRARMAIWIYDNFVEGDFVQRVEKRDHVKRPRSLQTVEPKQTI